MDKHTILNNIIETASNLMEMKVNENLVIIELMREKGDNLVVTNLEYENNKTLDAIKHMRVNLGCW